MEITVPYINEDFFSETPQKSVELILTNNNWSADYPYSPEIKVNLWHNGTKLFIHYEVNEEYVMALASEDNGEVWKDSCAEMFISFDKEGYYNLESNCIGKILLSHRKGRNLNVEYAPQSILNQVIRKSTLGDSIIPGRKQSEKWEMNLEIPASTFFKQNFKRFDGIHAKFNLYKCGDNLPSPHFISLFPIHTEKPDFHRPEFFGDIYFEEPEF